MPNWVENCLIVTGPDAADFHAEAQGDDPLFCRFVVWTRTDMDDEDAAVAVWGTKLDTQVTRRRGANLWFETAWDPPLGWVEKVSAQFPDAEFLIGYTEGGQGFWGTALFSAGQLQQEEHHTVGFWVEDADEPTVSPEAQIHMGMFGLGTGG